MNCHLPFRFEGPRRKQSRSTPMAPIYFLHIRDGAKLEPDPHGMEFPDIDAACTEARRVARELVEEFSEFGRETVIEIADEAGRTVMAVPVSGS